MVPSANFMEFIVFGSVLYVDPTIVQSIQNWLQLATLTDLRNFLGLAFFYMRFIKDFNDITTPLTDLTKAKTYI